MHSEIWEDDSYIESESTSTQVQIGMGMGS